MVKRALEFGAVVLLICGSRAAAGAPPGAVTISARNELSATVSPDGRYEIAVREPGWKFSGTVRAPLRNLSAGTGKDGAGAHQEITFAFERPAARRASLRIYEAAPAVVFSSICDAECPNSLPFPAFDRYPDPPFHLSFDGGFFQYSFQKLGAGSPWIFFDRKAHTFVLSPASHFMVAETRKDSSGRIECGIDPAIDWLPAGYEQKTILVAGRGIGETLGEWGRMLLALSGKKAISNDEGPDLERLGYWTDNGASYYYKFDPALGADGTLLKVAAQFHEAGIALGYVQLDSWWYPKGAGGGVLEYDAAGPPIFAAGLADFHRRLGLPLLVHARWIDASSPIRQKWKTSGGVVVDRGWWDEVAGRLSAAGVVTFEQDWLNGPATAQRNLVDPEAFHLNMAESMASRGIRIQYCGAQPGDILQSTLYQNVTTCRASLDRFDRNHWKEFFHGSLLARGVGLWPWCDVFRSSERDNLLLALLSGGVVGVGDAIGEENRDLLLRAARPDGVLVKPDTPLVPTDETLLREARGERPPIVCTTSSEFGAWKAVYVFSYAPDADKEIRLTPRELGFSGPAFLYNVLTGSGRWQNTDEIYRDRLAGFRSFYLVVSAERSGVAFLGDEGKFASLGKKRIAQVTDDDSLTARVVFAPGEGAVTLHGFARARPQVTASAGSAGPLSYDARSGEFHLPVSPSGGEAVISLQTGQSSSVKK